MVSTTDIAALGIGLLALVVGAASLGRGQGRPQTILLELPPSSQEPNPNDQGAGRDGASGGTVPEGFRATPSIDASFAAITSDPSTGAYRGP